MEVIEISTIMGERLWRMRNPVDVAVNMMQSCDCFEECGARVAECRDGISCCCDREDAWVVCQMLISILRLIWDFVSVILAFVK